MKFREIRPNTTVLGTRGTALADFLNGHRDPGGQSGRAKKEITLMKKQSAQREMKMSAAEPGSDGLDAVFGAHILREFADL